jgi:cell division protein FtsX
MNRNAVTSTIAALVALALIPVVWWFADAAIPPLTEIQTQASGNRLGPWFFTWALVWITALAAILVAWLCYSTREPHLNNVD